MPDYSYFNQIILLSRHPDIIGFCEHVLEPDFCIRTIANVSELGKIIVFFSPVFLIDCTSLNCDSVEPVIERCRLFKGTIILLVYKSVSRCKTLFDRKILPLAVPVPCDADLFRSVIKRAERIGQYIFDLPNVDHHTAMSVDIPGFEQLVGTSKELYEIKKTLSNVAAKNISLLMLGESGTGKSLAAEIVHNYSPRRHKKFKVVNMATIPEALAESELFGSVPGAYTGAVRRAGFFAEADGGTLFMDEIAEIPLSLQSKLLTVLDNKRFCSIGSDKEQQVDVRVIYATNANLLALVKTGKFRSDLYFRIAKFPVYFPSPSPTRGYKSFNIVIS